MLSDVDIDRIVGRLVSAISPLAVGIFGSYAIGSAKPGSDLDLLVIAEPSYLVRDRRRSVHAALRGIFHPLDAHVFSAEAFEAEAAQPLSFAWVIARQLDLRYATTAARDRAPSLSAFAARVAGAGIS